MRSTGCVKFPPHDTLRLFLSGLCVSHAEPGVPLPTGCKTRLQPKTEMAILIRTIKHAGCYVRTNLHTRTQFFNAISSSTRAKTHAQENSINQAGSEWFLIATTIDNALKEPSTYWETSEFSCGRSNLALRKRTALSCGRVRGLECY